MKFKSMYIAMTALSLVATPTLAAAAPVAAPVSTPLTQPAAESVQGDNALAGGSGIFIALLAAAAIAAGIAAAVSHSSSRPNSP